MDEKKKKYQNPELLVIRLNNDIITLSLGGTIGDGGDNEEPWEEE